MLPKQEVVAMLLAGGQGSRFRSTDKKTCQTSSSLWRKIPYYRFPTI